MELFKLRLFLAAAEEKSLSAAARSLYLSHSTLSRGITALENELGVKLMERSRSNIALTPAGELLQSEGKKLIMAVEDLEEKLKKLGDE